VTRPLVVHVVSTGADRLSLGRLGGPDRAARHALGPPDPDADVVVLHGRRAGWRARGLRDGRCVVVHRPAATERPGLAERGFLPWCDLVLARDEPSARALRSVLRRPEAAVAVLHDDDAIGWDDAVVALLDPEPARRSASAASAASTAPSPGPGDRLHLAPVARRAFGDELLVAAIGPDRGIDRFAGSAPRLWDELATGAAIAEVADRVRPSGGDPAIDAAVDDDVLAFARHLVRLGLAVPA
jgi:hypothetical protein